MYMINHMGEQESFKWQNPPTTQLKSQYLHFYKCCLMSVHTNLNSPLLLATRSGAQYLAEVSSTTMWTVLVVLPLLVLTRHSHFPVKPG